MQSRPVYIGFNPALFLQRQAFILESLREIKPTSIIDVGCGDGRILECLVRCNDDLPAENLVGLDIDRAALQSAAASIQSTGNDQQAEGRWRPVQVTLLQGTLISKTG
jgi:small RNA 2'-O-methyltransferase